MSCVFSDYTKLAELVVSTLQVRAGADLDAVTGSWDAKTALVVKHGLSTAIAKMDAPRRGGGGLVRLPPSAPMVA